MSMDMLSSASLLHGQRHAAWAWACSKNIDMNTGMGINMDKGMDMGMDKIWIQTTVGPAWTADDYFLRVLQRS
jgi:hypothetical protein